MDFKEITELIKLVGKSNLAEFKYKNQEVEIKIKTDKYVSDKAQNAGQGGGEIRAMPITATQMAGQYPPATAPSASQTASGTSEGDMGKEAKEKEPGKDLQEIRCPMVGTFYRSPSPDKPQYVKVGDKIEKGTVVCIVEAMKLFNEIESEISGTIVKVMTEDASPVEYDQVLFLVEP